MFEWLREFLAHGRKGNESASPGSQDGTLAPGAQLGRFVLESRLGLGRFGEVWKAQDTGSGISVALKILHHQSSCPSPVQALVEAGVARLASLPRHPNLARILNLLETGPNGRRYYSIEFCRGKPISSLSADDPTFAADYDAKAVSILEQVAGALEHIHRQGLVFGDLEAPNVILRSDGVVKLTDFDFVTSAWKPEFAEAQKNKAHLAPEVRVPESADLVDHRSDVYALGSLARVLWSDLGSEPDSGSEVRSEQTERLCSLRALVQQALEPNPENRIQSCTEFRRLLRRAISSKPRVARKQVGPARFGLKQFAIALVATLLGTIGANVVTFLVQSKWFRPSPGVNYDADFKSRHLSTQKSPEWNRSSLVSKARGPRLVGGDTLPPVPGSSAELPPLLDYRCLPREWRSSWNISFASICPTGAEPFWMARFETTWQQYLVFQPNHGTGASFLDLESIPIGNIPLHQAEAFCRFFGFRLPSSQDWEVAAYVAGKESAGPIELVIGSSSVFGRAYQAGPQPVGSMSASRRGIFDLRGNLSEWAGDSIPNPDERWDDALLLGGDYTDSLASILTNPHEQVWPQVSDRTIGFRCAIDGHYREVSPREHPSRMARQGQRWRPVPAHK